MQETAISRRSAEVPHARVLSSSLFLLPRPKWGQCRRLPGGWSRGPLSLWPFSCHSCAFHGHHCEFSSLLSPPPAGRAWGSRPFTVLSCIEPHSPAARLPTLCPVWTSGPSSVPEAGPPHHPQLLPSLHLMSLPLQTVLSSLPSRQQTWACPLPWL